MGLASCPMDKDILICLQALEWIRLEPHLPSDVWERLTEDDRGMPMLEGRIVPDDATYQRILEMTQIHCPEIVKPSRRKGKNLWWKPGEWDRREGRMSVPRGRPKSVVPSLQQHALSMLRVPL